jgi:hypothetical protein
MSFDVESPDEGFEALCASLQRKDPNVTSVGAIFGPLIVPPGQIRRLGEALHGTTSVAALILSVESLQQSPDTLSMKMRVCFDSCARVAL